MHNAKQERINKMKNLISIILVFGVLLLIIPSISLLNGNTEQAEIKNSVLDIKSIKEPASYKMLDNNTGEIVEMQVREYLIGAVFAQMPASFEPEALKAQAVLCHTYILRQHIIEESSPTAELKGADFSTDTNKYQAYFTQEQAKSIYGSNYDVNYAKIAAAADSVINKVITYNGSLIVTAFHSMSGGITESANIAWGLDLPYLSPVESIGETTEKGFLEEKTYSTDEMSARLVQGIDGIALGDDKSTWLKIVEKSPSGSVLKVQAGDKEVTGSIIKEIFTLRSAFFDIEFDGSVFKITTKGVGHGVGLSQYGANSMAKNASTYEQILQYYYTDVNIDEVI